MAEVFLMAFFSNKRDQWNAPKLKLEFFFLLNRATEYLPFYQSFRNRWHRCWSFTLYDQQKVLELEKRQSFYVCVFVGSTFWINWPILKMLLSKEKSCYCRCAWTAMFTYHHMHLLLVCPLLYIEQYNIEKMCESAFRVLLTFNGFS